jgi:NAD(P)H-flavin reductase
MENKIEKTATFEEGRDPMLTYPFYVQRLRHETHDTFTLELKPAREVDMAGFKPGQFNMLYVFGLGEVPISISGNPENTERLIHTVRAVGAVTKTMGKLRRGYMMGVRGPFGVGWPIKEAEGKDVLIIAGGIGLAPLRPALYYILTHRKNYGKVSLLYGTRTPDDIIFLRELEKWRARLDLEVFITVDRARGEWRGNVGVVTTLIPKAPFEPGNSLAMVCGPEVMMRFCALELQKRGLPPDAIYFSLERNMKCGIGICGHCQLGGVFVCKDGPVFRFDRIRDLFSRREL